MKRSCPAKRSDAKRLLKTGRGLEWDVGCRVGPVLCGVLRWVLETWRQARTPPEGHATRVYQGRGANVTASILSAKIWSRLPLIERWAHGMLNINSGVKRDVYFCSFSTASLTRNSLCLDCQAGTH